MNKYEGHTPGPWHIGMRPGPAIYDAFGSQVVMMREPLLSGDENVANARLIADAPTLLAQRDALAAALTTILNRAYSHDDRDHYSETFDADFSRAGTVLERITGWKP